MQVENDAQGFQNVQPVFCLLLIDVRIADLPILPQKWQYLVSASTKKQFGILQKLMHRPDVDSVICATDAG